MNFLKNLIQNSSHKRWVNDNRIWLIISLFPHLNLNLWIFYEPLTINIKENDQINKGEELWMIAR